MGDRANVIFKQENGYLGLYLHNGGYSLKNDTAIAIQRVINAGRTNDIDYATRIAVSSIIGEDWSQDYSYGLRVGTTIDEAIADNQNDIVVIDWKSEKVEIYTFDYSSWGIKEASGIYSLKEFVQKYID